MVKDELTVNENGNLTEITLLYPKVKSPLLGVSAYLKFKKYNQKLSECINLAEKKQSIDIAHLQAIFPACIPTLSFLKSKNIPLFITEHWTGYSKEDNGYTGFIKKYFTKMIIQKAQAILVVSKKQQLAMEDHGLFGNYQVVNNVVNTSIFKPSSENIINTGETLNVLHVSSLDERQKNTTAILKVVQQLNQQHKKVRLTIVGGNTDAITHYRKITKELLIENYVEFLGNKNANEIALEMQKADVLVLMSHFEWTPVVISEAIACGLPVLSSNVGDIKAMIPDGFGKVLNDNTIDAFVNELLIFKKSDYKDASTMHAYISNHYGEKAVAEALIKIYKEVVPHV